jgi:4-hydroxybenzoate polyprenyltransferase
VEMLVVVGGKGSGNTQRLVKVAEAQGVKALHVETEEDIRPSMVIASELIGVTAGASTPNWQIRGVIDRLKEIGMSRRTSLLKRLRRVAEIAVMTYGIAALAGGGLTAACMVLQGRQETWLPMCVTMLFVFSMHLLNRIQERSGAVRFNTPEIASFYARHRGVLAALGALASLGAIMLSFLGGIVYCLLLTGMLLMGRLYGLPIFSRSAVAGLRWRSLKDLPGSKTPVVAIGWGVCASVLPVLGSEGPIFPAALAIAFLFAAGAVFWRTALSDLLDLQGDRIVGRETIPILIGVRKTRKFLVFLVVVMALLLLGSVALGLVPVVGCWLTLNILIFGIFYMVYRRRPLVNRLLFEGLLDGNLVLAGAVSILYGM